MDEEKKQDPRATGTTLICGSMISLAMGIAGLVLHAKEQGSCEGTKIPAALLAPGILFLVGGALSFIVGICLVVYQEKAKAMNFLYQGINCMIGSAQLGILIAASIWVWNLENEPCKAEPYYESAKNYMIAWYVMLGVSCCLVICAVACAGLVIGAIAAGSKSSNKL
eukprot:TRINITY_DN5240_c0_g1_i1.p1 TRINITY_DN5240_c0_g1~~TRINITY_DN5240_c0_g1_i1.p1  ORF type:complete len:195 (+),score=41.42 TRINITY_DN5240_c0_g1_i1:87-587(+)